MNMSRPKPWFACALLGILCYALFNAYAAWNFRPNMSVRANVRNITDETFINSLYDISYYGTPRNYSVSLDWRF